MSFDLLLFDKEKAPKSFDAFGAWQNTQTDWRADYDYNTPDGTAPALAAWFMEMKEIFPPLNGPFAPGDEALADDRIEKRLTDYSLGEHIIYAAFGWPVCEEACALAQKLAHKHGIGFYNPQTGGIICDGMVTCLLRTENDDTDRSVVWEQVEREIFTLDAPERAGAFLTMWFAHNGTDEQFMQCMPVYAKPPLFSLRFGKAKNKPLPLLSYTVEASTGEKIYTKTVSDKQQVAFLLRDYYTGCRLPDLTGWIDSGIL